MLSVTETRNSRYLTYAMLRDSGIEPGRCALIVDHLFRNEPVERTTMDDHFEPSEADWADYCEWSDRIETMEALHDEDETIERFLAWRDDTRR